MSLRRLLFPTDFSESAEHALPHALEIASRFDARIIVLHARTLFADDPSQPEYQLLNQKKYEQELEERLEKMSNTLESSDRVDTVIERNLSAASAILEFVADRNIDMVVMGTHGRSGLSHFFLGSVAEKVVRHAACPVLTVGSRGKDYRDQPVYQKILATFDFSEASKAAVRRGHKFAQAYEATLEVLYVVEQVVPPPLDEIWQVSVRSDLPAVVASAETSLAEAWDEEDLGKVNLQVKVGDADGKAEGEIVKYAREGEFDLVVMGTHGLSGLEHALLGSTTERVVRTAPCPVLTFHQPGD